VDPSVGLDVVAKRKIIEPAGNQTAVVRHFSELVIPVYSNVYEVCYVVTYSVSKVQTVKA
jgi:hypothetical protein